MHQLMIHCHFAFRVWTAAINLFDFEWVMPRTVEDLFHQWGLRCKFVRGKILWKWKLWLERNNRVMRNESNPMEVVVESIVLTMSECVSKRKEFKGVSLEELNRSWAAILKGGWCAKVLHRVFWMCRPHGVFKFNFDGSCLQSIYKGGFGGVIKDCNSNVVRSWFGPVDSSDGNESGCLLF